MARRRRDERRGFLDDLAATCAAYPHVGSMVAIALGACGAYLYWINPRAIIGTGPIWGIVLWLLAAVALTAASAGLINRRRRAHRLDSQRTIPDLHAMTWQQFEQLVADLFRRQGYRVHETGGQSDGGVDLILDKDGDEHLVQCKQYKAWKVGAPRVREFYGAMAAHATQCEGIYVTCGRFTREASEFANGKPLRLIDGYELLEMIAQTNNVAPAVATSMPRHESRSREQTPSQTLPSPAVGAAPMCDDCNVQMVRRVATRGSRAGQPFWGCPNFPRCKRIVNIG